MLQLLMSASFALWMGLIQIAVPVPEPLSLEASSSSSFLLTNEVITETTPMSLRVGSRLTPVVDSSRNKLNLVESSLGFTRTLGRSFAVDLNLLARAILDDATAGIPDRIGLRLRYQPELGSRHLRLGFLVGGSFGSDLKWGTLGPRVGTAFVGTSIGGSFALVRYAAQITAGAGRTHNAPGGETSVPAEASAGAALSLPFLDASLALEAGARTELLHVRAPWSVLAVAGFLVPVSMTLQVHLAATATRNVGGELQYGGLLALTGRLSTGDLDNDNIPDAEDACPSAPGVAEYYGCPFTDGDGDGVWDRFDACPERKGPAVNAGCPFEDSNNNGIPDIDEAGLDVTESKPKQN